MSSIAGNSNENIMSSRQIPCLYLPMSLSQLCLAYGRLLLGAEKPRVKISKRVSQNCVPKKSENEKNRAKMSQISIIQKRHFLAIFTITHKERFEILLTT